MKAWVLLALLLCVFTAGSNGIPLFRKFLEGLKDKANISNNDSTEEVKKHVSSLGDLLSSTLTEIRGAVSPNHHHHHRFHRHHLMRWNLRRTTPNPYRFSWDPEYRWGENATTEYPTEDWEETEYPTENWGGWGDYPTRGWEEETEYPTEDWEEETEYPTEDWEEETEYPTEDWRETNRYEWRTTRNWWEGTKSWWNTYTTKAWWPMETTRNWWETTRRWWQTRRPWWERPSTTESWEIPTHYPWWWQQTTEAPWELPTEEWIEPETTESSHGGFWWGSIIKPKHIKKGFQLFRDLDNDE